ncbi:CD0415/CD1112 family protein, partial [Faecalibacterium prausnitzii]|uniref:VirB6/TrbL-like conjugal transfer protein, CD1112 family n=1 Tax=Faecalibacterium prausnitzii TaxID=853 RepID=UPI0023B1205D
RWIFMTADSVWLISNTFDIVKAVFDITQKVVSDSSGIIAGNTRVNDIGLSMLQSSLMQM